MPRGKRPAPRPQTQSERISQFAGRIEQAAPEWLDDWIERRRVLLERFYEKDDDGKYVASVAEQNRIHASLAVSEADMLKFAALREQHMKAKGLSAYADRGEGVTNVMNLNFAPSMTPEQRAYAERLFLSSLSGKEVTPPLILEAKQEVA